MSSMSSPFDIDLPYHHSHCIIFRLIVSLILFLLCRQKCSWNKICKTTIITVVPVFSGLCDQGTPAVSGQYNDVRGDFQYKLTRDQGTPANADADRHLFVIFAPQPGDSALFILFFITLGRKRYQISLLMRIISLKRMSNRFPQLRTPNNNDASRRCASWEK